MPYSKSGGSGRVIFLSIITVGSPLYSGTWTMSLCQQMQASSVIPSFLVLAAWNSTAMCKSVWVFPKTSSNGHLLSAGTAGPQGSQVGPVPLASCFQHSSPKHLLQSPSAASPAPHCNSWQLCAEGSPGPCRCSHSLLSNKRGKEQWKEQCLHSSLISFTSCYFSE